MRRFGLVLVMAASLFAVAWTAAADEPMPPLVSPQWLIKHLKDSDLKILDARGDRKAYRAGRIPGAVFTDYDNDGWREARDGVPGLLPSVEELEALIGSLGIDNDTHVIIVAPGDNAADMGIATRIYWTFKILGDDHISVLNGGMKGYLAAEGPVLAGVTESPTAKRFTADFRPELLASTAQVQKAMENGDTLVDNRPPAQFLGRETSSVVTRPGAIPGAKNVPAIAMTGATDGFFKDKADLKQLYAKAGVDPAMPTVTYCNTGHWASIGWFVQSALLGNPKVRLYDGSLAAWSRNPALPMTIPTTR